MRVKSLNAGLVSAIFAVLVLLVGAVSSPSQAATFEEELDKFIQEPLIQAIIDEDPVIEQSIRKRMTDAFQSGGQEGLAREAQKLGEEYGQPRMMSKMPGARDADIIEFFTTSVAITRKLEFEDPNICYQWAYGPQYNDRFNPKAYEVAVGDALNKRMIEAIVGVIKNASDIPVVYDRVAAQLGLQTAANAVFGRLPIGPLQVISGMRPASSLQEKTEVCRATGDLYAFVLGLDNAPDALREMFAPRPNVTSHLGMGGMVAMEEVFKSGDPENFFAGNKQSLMNAFR